MRLLPRRWATGQPGRSWVVRLLRVLLLVALAPVPFILLFAVVNPPVTMVMMGRAVQRFAAGESPAWPVHTPVARSAMSPSLRRAVLASEDDRFYLHHGIDFVELDKALERRKRGGKLRGASTLSQQVAKNIFLWNGRSFVRKGVEAYLTLWLELLLTKERILDLYINLAEWGPYHFGAEAGARYHFRKSAASLTREESARMAAILPAPRRWAPRGSVASRRIGPILQRMQYAPPTTEQAK
ncbi:MAG: monofunctional biosynthetic peptidoglycan transglycosylase [Gemmatimonas sp.]|uniref:monofunctional biosynthetic peptidoglycan transglycosylase n=1 Tax=Gemmatimonas sp. TaxID=1962908 RepID=UPI00391B03E8